MTPLPSIVSTAERGLHAPKTSVFPSVKISVYIGRAITRMNLRPSRTHRPRHAPACRSCFAKNSKRPRRIPPSQKTPPHTQTDSSTSNLNYQVKRATGHTHGPLLRVYTKKRNRSRATTRMETLHPGDEKKHPLPASMSDLAADKAEHHAADVELYLVLLVESQQLPFARAALLVNRYRVMGRRHFLSLLRASSRRVTRFGGQVRQNGAKHNIVA